MADKTLKSIQSMLDENKEKIPEGIYLGLSNLMKQKYEEEQKTEKFYKVTCVRTNHVNNWVESFGTQLVRFRQILKMPQDQYIYIKECIEEDGFYTPSHGICRQHWNTKIANELNYHNDIQRHCIRCPYIEEHDEGRGDDEGTTIHITDTATIVKIEEA